MQLLQRCLLLVLLSLIGSKLPAQVQLDACALLPKATVPEQDRFTPEAMRAMGVVPQGAPDRSVPQSGVFETSSGCYGEELYYGSDPKRFAMARACVLAKLGIFRVGVTKVAAFAAQSAAAGGATEPQMIDREGLVLSMIYANGEGVQRNVPLARQFLCEYGPGIESEDSQEQVRKFDALTADGKRLDMCSKDIDFGRGVNYDCLGMERERRDKEMVSRESAILADAPPTVRRFFLEVRRAWKTFHAAYSVMDETLCDGGTGCGPITEDDDMQFTALWLVDLKAMQDGIAPPIKAKAADLAGLDRVLNEKYRAALKEAPDCRTGEECSEAAIRSAGRAWLRYREAWVHFGTLRWPSVPADQWRAWQTAEWLHLLTLN